MRLFSISLLLCFATISSAAIMDPVGDTFGSGMPFDIISTSGVTTGNSTTFEIRFATPVPANLDEHLWGAIGIDVDRDPTTGKRSEIGFPDMNYTHGEDYVIGFYYDDAAGSAFILDVTNDDFFSIPAEYGPHYFRVTVPIRGTQPDGRMHYAVGVGDGQDLFEAYSDLAGNDYQLLTTDVAPVP